MATGNKQKYLEYVKPKLDAHLKKAVTSVFRELGGVPAKVAKKEAPPAKNTSDIITKVKPKAEEVDWTKTTRDAYMGIDTESGDGEAWLKSGKFVKGF
jgi:hypothetical protein